MQRIVKRGEIQHTTMSSSRKHKHLGLQGEYKKVTRANVLLIFQQCMKISA